MERIDREQEKMFRMINENSLNKKIEEEQQRVLYEQQLLRETNKLKFKKKLKNILIVSAVVSGLVAGGYVSKDYIVRQNDLNDAIKYMSETINFVCPDLDREVLSDNTVYLFNNDGESLSKIVDELQSKYGFSRDCAIYCVSEKYGESAFNEVVKQYGFKDKDDFLYSYYSKPTSLSSSGETVYSKEGSYRVFENNVQNELINKVNSIKSNVDSKLLNSRGMKR